MYFIRSTRNPALFFNFEDYHWTSNTVARTGFDKEAEAIEACKACPTNHAEVVWIP